MKKLLKNRENVVGIKKSAYVIYEWPHSETDSDTIFDTEESIVFNGHKSAITSMVFDSEGHRCGSSDNFTNLEFRIYDFF